MRKRGCPEWVGYAVHPPAKGRCGGEKHFKQNRLGLPNGWQAEGRRLLLSMVMITISITAKFTEYDPSQAPSEKIDKNYALLLLLTVILFF